MIEKKLHRHSYLPGTERYTRPEEIKALGKFLREVKETQDEHTELEEDNLMVPGSNGNLKPSSSDNSLPKIPQEITSLPNQYIPVDSTLPEDQELNTTRLPLKTESGITELTNFRENIIDQNKPILGGESIKLEGKKEVDLEKERLDLEGIPEVNLEDKRLDIETSDIPLDEKRLDLEVTDNIALPEDSISLQKPSDLNLEEDVITLSKPSDPGLENEVISLQGRNNIPLEDEVISLQGRNNIPLEDETITLQKPSDVSLEDETITLQKPSDISLSEEVDKLENPRKISNLEDHREEISDSKDINLSSEVKKIQKLQDSQLSETKIEINNQESIELGETVEKLEKDNTEIQLETTLDTINPPKLDSLDNTLETLDPQQDVKLSDKKEVISPFQISSLNDTKEIIPDQPKEVTLEDKKELLEGNKNVSLETQKELISTNQTPALTTGKETLRGIKEITSLDTTKETVNSPGEIPLETGRENLVDKKISSLSDTKIEISNTNKSLSLSSEKITIQPNNTPDLETEKVILTGNKDPELPDEIETLEGALEVSLGTDSISLETSPRINSLEDHLEELSENGGVNSLEDEKIDISVNGSQITSLPGQDTVKVLQGSEQSSITSLETHKEEIQGNNDKELSTIRIDLDEGDRDISLEDHIENIKDTDDLSLEDKIINLLDSRSNSLPEDYIPLEIEEEIQLEEFVYTIDTEDVELEDERLDIDPGEDPELPDDLLTLSVDSTINLEDDFSVKMPNNADLSDRTIISLDSLRRDDKGNLEPIDTPESFRQYLDTDKGRKDIPEGRNPEISEEYLSGDIRKRIDRPDNADIGDRTILSHEALRRDKEGNLEPIDTPESFRQYLDSEKKDNLELPKDGRNQEPINTPESFGQYLDSEKKDNLELPKDGRNQEPINTPEGFGQYLNSKRKDNLELPKNADKFGDRTITSEDYEIKSDKIEKVFENKEPIGRPDYPDLELPSWGNIWSGNALNPSTYIRWSAENSVGKIPVNGVTKQKLINETLAFLVYSRDIVERATKSNRDRLPGDEKLIRDLIKGTTAKSITSKVLDSWGKRMSGISVDHSNPLNRPQNGGKESEWVSPGQIVEDSSYPNVRKFSDYIKDSYLVNGDGSSSFGMGVTLNELIPNTTPLDLENFKSALKKSKFITTPEKITSTKYSSNYITLDSNHIWEIIFRPYCGVLNGNRTWLPSFLEIDMQNKKAFNFTTHHSRGWLPITGFELQEKKLTSKDLPLFDGSISYPISMEFTNEIRISFSDDSLKSIRRYFDLCAKVSAYMSNIHTPVKEDIMNELDGLKFIDKESLYDYSIDDVTQIKNPTVVLERKIHPGLYKNLSFLVTIYILTPQFGTIKKCNLLCVLKDYTIENQGDIDSSPTELNVTFSIVGENPWDGIDYSSKNKSYTLPTTENKMKRTSDGILDNLGDVVSVF